MTAEELLQCVTARWSPTIGDPTALGWTVVVAYAATAILALAAALRSDHPARVRAFWAVICVFMAALAVNKQLDLQSALTQVGRCLARAQGWYDERRQVQIAFIIAIGAATALAALGSLILMRRHLARIGLATLGLWMVLGYVGVRAAGFHHFDRLIATPIAGVRVNPLLELSGIALILANAAWMLARHVRRPDASAWDRSRARR